MYIEKYFRNTLLFIDKGTRGEQKKRNPLYYIAP